MPPRCHRQRLIGLGFLNGTRGLYCQALGPKKIEKLRGLKWQLKVFSREYILWLLRLWLGVKNLTLPIIQKYESIFYFSNSQASFG
jgi:hypothetical protein